MRVSGSADGDCACDQARKVAPRMPKAAARVQRVESRSARRLAVSTVQ